MAEPERKLAFQKSTGSWVIVQPAGDGYEVAETLDEDQANWTGEAYDLAVAHPKASVELKPKLDWYRDNMLGEPTGPLDENGKTTETPLSAYEQPATPAPAPTQAAPAVAEPVVEQSPWAAFANASTRLGRHVMGDSFLRPMPNEAETDMPEEDRDFGRGLAQGFTFRLGDEGTAALESALPQPSGTPGEMRAAGRGVNAPLMTEDEREDAVETETLARERQANAQAQERSPWAYGIGEGVGMTPAAIATAPVFGTATAAGVPWGALAARSAVQGAAMGAAAGAGGSQEGSRLSDSAMGAATGAAGGAAGSMLGTGIGIGVQRARDSVTRATGPLRARIAEWADEAADTARNASIGGFGGRAQVMAEREGIPFVKSHLARTVEHQLPPELGRYGLPKLRSAGDYAAAAGARRQVFGEQQEQALNDLTEAGVTAPMRGADGRTGVLDAVERRAGGLRSEAHRTGDESTMLESLEGSASRIARDYGEEIPESAVVSWRGGRAGVPDEIGPQEYDVVGVPLQREVIKGEAPVAGLPVAKGPKLDPLTLMPKRAEARPLTANEMQALKRKYDRQGQPVHALKGTPQGVQKEASRYVADSVRGALNDAVDASGNPQLAARYHEAADNYGPMKIAEALGNRRDVADAAGPAPQGLWPAITGALRDNYGADASAYALRAGAQAIAPRLGPSSPAAQQAAQTLGARAGVPWGALARRGQPIMAQPGEQRVEIGEAQIIKRDDRQARAEQSQGHNVQSQVATALRAYPNALGPFKQQLKAAEGDPVRMSAAISDAMSDPRWATVVQPQLDEVDAFRREKEAGQ